MPIDRRDVPVLLGGAVIVIALLVAAYLISGG
jgi:hypothetical protein